LVAEVEVAWRLFLNVNFTAILFFALFAGNAAAFCDWIVRVI
jgi:hypothetical protein